MIVLGIETSCDETAAAVVDGERRIRANVVRSQLAEHRPYGGVVPEIAARAHVEHLDGIVRRALAEAAAGPGDLAAVAATGGPGLIGGVIVGVTYAKAFALGRGLPFVAVNHLEGHALTVRLTDGIDYPYLLLLLTGGHCQLQIVEGVGRYTRLGTTVDDAVGEAFDKVAKLLGLGYPGGPAVERAAATGRPGRFALPRPMKGQPGCHFSFAGLKTAVRQLVDRGAIKEDQDIADLCLAFQDAVADVLADRTAHALAAFVARFGPGTLVIAGGVAANRAIRERLAILAAQSRFRLIAPPAALCTDNAAMIAWAGIERLRAGLADGLDFAPRPRWPLDPAAPPAVYAGVKA